MKALRYSIGFLLLAFGFGLHAQQQPQTQPQQQLNCTQQLRTARSTYDAGRLHEVPQWLTGCLSKAEDAGGFSKAERLEAYRMLALTYIYLEEPDKADVEMINLLNAEHFYTLNDLVDPIEFKNMYKKFRTDPVFRYGFKFGANTNHIKVLSNYYMWGPGAGKYSAMVGVQAGLIFEKDLRLRGGKVSRFTLSPEMLWSSYGFVYSNSALLFPSYEGAVGETLGTAEHTISQSRLQLNALVQYRLDNYTLADKFIPYVSAGPAVITLLTSTFDGNTNAGEQVTGSATPNKTNYNPVVFGAILAAGIKVRLGGLYLTADVRHQAGLGNVVSEKNRYQNEVVFLQYGYVDNDFSMSHTMASIGLTFPYFNPKKLIK